MIWMVSPTSKMARTPKADSLASGLPAPDVLPTFSQPPASTSSSTQPPASNRQTDTSSSTSQTQARTPRPVSSTAKHIRTLSVGAEDDNAQSSEGLGGDEDSAAFEAELMKGMEELLAGLGAAGTGTGVPGATPAKNRGGPSGSGPGHFYDTPIEQGVGDEEKQLQELFARLMSGAGGAEGPGGDKDFDGLMKEMMEAAAGGVGAPAKGKQPPQQTPAHAPGASKPTFDETIRASLKNLNKPAPAASSAASGADDPLTALLEQFAASNGGAAGGMGADGQDFGGLLDGMMRQLMTREILEEPLSELADKYPPYLDEQARKQKEGVAGAISESQLETYRKQHAIVREILETFKAPEYSDDNDELKGRVTEKMTAMQDLGSPPDEIMGGMPEGMVSSSCRHEGGPRH